MGNLSDFKRKTSLRARVFDTPDAPKEEEAVAAPEEDDEEKKRRMEREAAKRQQSGRTSTVLSEGNNLG